MTLDGGRLCELRDGILYARGPSRAAEPALADLRTMAHVARAATAEEAAVSSIDVAFETMRQRRRIRVALIGCLAVWIGAVVILALALRK